MTEKKDTKKKETKIPRTLEEYVDLYGTNHIYVKNVHPFHGDIILSIGKEGVRIPYTAEPIDLLSKITLEEALGSKDLRRALSMTFTDDGLSDQLPALQLVPPERVNTGAPNPVQIKKEREDLKKAIEKLEEVASEDPNSPPPTILEDVKRLLPSESGEVSEIAQVLVGRYKQGELRSKELYKEIRSYASSFTKRDINYLKGELSSLKTVSRLLESIEKSFDNAE